MVLPIASKEAAPTIVMLFDESKRLPARAVPSAAVAVFSVERVLGCVSTVPINGTSCNSRVPFNVRAPVEASNWQVVAVPGLVVTVTVTPVDGSVNWLGGKVYVHAPVVVLSVIVIETDCEEGPGNKALSDHAVAVPVRVFVTVLSCAIRV